MTYLIEGEHTKEECLRSLDELSETSPQLLDKSYLGCMSGEHKSYAFVEASSESEIHDMIPAGLRGKTRVVKVDRFTPEQIRSFHQS